MKKRLLIVCSIVIGLLLMAFLLVFISKLVNYECPIYKYLHLTCAGCGTTRMLEEMFHLHFIRAFKYNPLMFILSIIFGIYLVYAGILYIRKGKIIKPSSKVIIGIGILLIVYMMVRNIPALYYLRPDYLE